MDELSRWGGESLRTLFDDLVWRHFFDDVGLDEPQVARYVSRLLADFTFVDRLYRMKSASGQRLEHVAEMIIASNPALEAPSFDRERELRKHVGDFTLFMSGLFPEKVAKTAEEMEPQIDALIDFVRAGKESYAIVSSFDQWEYREEAALFRQLSNSFELCVEGLHLVKYDLAEFQAESHDPLQATNKEPRMPEAEP